MDYVWVRRGGGSPLKACFLCVLFGVFFRGADRHITKLVFNQPNFSSLSCLCLLMFFFFTFQLLWKIFKTRRHAVAAQSRRLSPPRNCFYSEIDFSLSGEQSLPRPRPLRRLSFSVSTNQGHKASSSCPFISLPSIQKANRGQSSQMSPLIDWGEDE